MGRGEPKGPSRQGEGSRPQSEPLESRRTGTEPGWSCQTSATARAAPSGSQRSAWSAPATRTCGPHAAVGPHVMAVMVLGMPQVHSCHASTNPGMLWSVEVSEARVCPPSVFRDEVEVSARGEQLDPSLWRKLPAMHCQVTQSVLTFMCRLDSRMGKVKFGRFRQHCGIQPTACWEA
jgi:hypothetical protein